MVSYVLHQLLNARSIMAHKWASVERYREEWKKRAEAMTFALQLTILHNSCGAVKQWIALAAVNKKTLN